MVNNTCLLTGILTGSVYKDFALLRNGFPAESVKDGRVLVVKTHESGEPARSLFKKAILLVRKPSEAILAEFNRRAAGHIGHAGRDKYTRNAGRCKFLSFLHPNMKCVSKCANSRIFHLNNHRSRFL